MEKPQALQLVQDECNRLSAKYQLKAFVRTPSPINHNRMKRRLSHLLQIQDVAFALLLIGCRLWRWQVGGNPVATGGIVGACVPLKLMLLLPAPTNRHNHRAVIPSVGR